MDHAIRFTKVIALFILYAWLCREFYLFSVIDACLDGGGAYDASIRACSVSPFGQNWDVGARASIWFWVLLLGFPAVVVYAIHKMISVVVSRVRRPPPNHTVERDARKSSARPSL
jgi:hypothetical protein